MSVPSSVEELLQLIRKSGMIEDQKLTAYLQRRQAGRGLPPDPREAADSMVKDGLITNFQAEQFLLGKWRGFTIGKYKLLERVGVGGMGQVFLCEHMYMKRRVAIKVLPPAKAEQPAALGRFYREARAAGSLEHVNIVRTHDIDQDGNLHFIVMEYVDGSNLLDMVKKAGPMDIRRASHYIRQVALGLDFAFKSGIIHRDIKPGNVLVDRKGVAKILDMGLARFYKDQTDMLTVKYDDKIVLGTADYVAPEQVANSHQVDIRADIYAMGASFYFLLAGHPAFPTGTVSQKLLWHRTKDPTPIRQIRPEVPEGIAAIVTKMLAKDPNTRYQTPLEVANDLEKWVPAEIPVPTLEEMPQLSLAALEEEPSGEQSFIVPETASQSQLIESVASKPAQRPQAANPFSAPAQAPKSFVGTQSAGTAVAPPPPSKREPSLAGPKTSRLQPLSQMSPPKRAEATFPPNPFAPGSNSNIQTLTAVDASATPADPHENYHRPQPVSQHDQSSFVTNVFGDNGKTKMMVFVVLVTMCLTLGVGLLGMKLLKSPTPKPATSEAK
jgi:eukaryotic-like serine/threonine-protein kinase